MEKHRLLIDLTPDSLRKIDFWAKQHNFKRKKAIEVLVIKGLNAERFGKQLDLNESIYTSWDETRLKELYSILEFKKKWGHDQVAINGVQREIDELLERKTLAEANGQ